MKKLKYLSVFVIIFSAFAFACDGEAVTPLNGGEDEDESVLIMDDDD
ncbi:hypothetical protein [Fulvivirga sp. M361]|nr:hypothetical protein [Fulvivirga sp. M361]